MKNPFCYSVRPHVRLSRPNLTYFFSTVPLPPKNLGYVPFFFPAITPLFPAFIPSFSPSVSFPSFHPFNVSRSDSKILLH